MLPRQPNQSVIDGFRCLQFVVSSEEPCRVTQLAAELDLEQTRVHRLLRTLGHLGLVVQTDGRRYAPGPAIPGLAAQTLHASHFADKALPQLEKLRREVGLTVAMGVLWERSISYLYHGGAKARLEEAIGGHGLWPASQSGLGIACLARMTDSEVAARYKGHSFPGFRTMKSLRAELAKTRAQGYAFAHTVGDERTLAVSLPNSPSLALGVTGKLRQAGIRKLLPQLLAAASAVDQGLELFKVR
jgi:DNA-binding IclR family transcriptional regulator